MDHGGDGGGLEDRWKSEFAGRADASSFGVGIRSESMPPPPPPPRHVTASKLKGILVGPATKKVRGHRKNHRNHRRAAVSGDETSHFPFFTRGDQHRANAKVAYCLQKTD